MDNISTPQEKIAGVAIGRNEGERLKLCLKALTRYCNPVVYVDSGSTDGSSEFAKSIGVHVVDLDTSIPFTASRARNIGFAKVCELVPDIDYVQFVDGDCELTDNWVKDASEVLRNNPKVASVCGRRRERFRQASIYNRLMDLEWERPAGEETRTFGW